MSLIIQIHVEYAKDRPSLLMPGNTNYSLHNYKRRYIKCRKVEH